jgi:3-deoxy-D-manno-octulosonic-acid transferase
MFGLYGLLLRLAWAVVLPYQFVMAPFRGPEGPRPGERLALAGSLRTACAGGFWIHAVSVGEVRLAMLLTAALRRGRSGLAIHLTTGTATGRALALEARRAGNAGAPDSVSYLPIDLPGPLRRFFAAIRPRAVLILETELWPHLLDEARRHDVPLLLVNGRLSPRSFPRYRRIRPLLARTLPHARLFAMQSEEDAGRIRELGAPADRVVVTGSLKFDLPPPAVDEAVVRRRIATGPDVTIFVAGSTARGEEEAILAAFAALRRHDPAARLILAPRHPEDLEAAARALQGARLRTERYTTAASAGPWDALLVDVVGVLPQLYAAATVAFVGGSLTTRGGQNLLEPAALGKPVLFGPHVENFRAAAQALLDAGGGFMARDAGELGRLASRLAGDPVARGAAGAGARAVVEANRGALARTLRVIDQALGAPVTP